MSRQEPLSLKNLQLLHFGEIEAVFKQQLQHCVRDCMERPLEKSDRTITIQFLLKPEAVTSGSTVDCDKIAVACDVSSRTPKLKTRVYQMTPRHDGALLFHPDLPDEPEGDALFDPDQLPARTDNGGGQRGNP